MTDLSNWYPVLAGAAAGLGVELIRQIFARRKSEADTGAVVINSSAMVVAQWKGLYEQMQARVKEQDLRLEELSCVAETNKQAITSLTNQVDDLKDKLDQTERVIAYILTLSSGTLLARVRTMLSSEDWAIVQTYMQEIQDRKPPRRPGDNPASPP